MAVTISVDMYELTYGDLFAFADLARAGGADPNAGVIQEPSFGSDDIVARLSASMDPAMPGPHVLVIPHDQATQLRAALDEVLASDGDARGSLTMLEDLRDRLRPSPPSQ